MQIICVKIDKKVFAEFFPDALPRDYSKDFEMFASATRKS